MGIKLHDRYFVVREADRRISNFVSDIWKELGLTPIELVMICGSLAHRFATYALRDERHPGDFDRKADEA